MHPDARPHDLGLIVSHVVIGDLTFGKLFFRMPGIGRCRTVFRSWGASSNRVTAGKRRIQSVVIRRGDRIKLVIVTTGTGDCQAQQSPADDIDLIVDQIMDAAILHSDCQKTESRAGRGRSPEAQSDPPQVAPR